MKMTQDKNFHKLNETDTLIVGHIYETAYIFDKKKVNFMYQVNFMAIRPVH